MTEFKAETLLAIQAEAIFGPKDILGGLPIINTKLEQYLETISEGEIVKNKASFANEIDDTIGELSDNAILDIIEYYDQAFPRARKLAAAAILYASSYDAKLAVTSIILPDRLISMMATGLSRATNEEIVGFGYITEIQKDENKSIATGFDKNRAASFAIDSGLKKVVSLSFISEPGDKRAVAFYADHRIVDGRMWRGIINPDSSYCYTQDYLGTRSRWVRSTNYGIIRYSEPNKEDPADRNIIGDAINEHRSRAV